MWSIGGTRFTTDTHSQNSAWRNRQEFKGCIYGVMQPLAETIYTDSFVIVMEMINDTNTIAGIGIVQNTLEVKRYVSLYENTNYNNYVYDSKYRIDASEFTPEERAIILIFEIILFTGSTHLKRGQGITTVSEAFISKARKAFGKPDTWTRVKKDSIYGMINKCYNNEDKSKIAETIYKFMQTMTLETLINKVKTMFKERFTLLPHP